MRNIFLAIALLFAPAAMGGVGIAAIVNGDAITTLEVANQAKLARAVSEASKSKAPDALESLIENRIKIQEGAKFNIGASEPEIRDAMQRFRRHMKLDTDAKFKEFVSKNGGEEALRAQLEAEVVWNKIVWQVLRGYVNVSDNEIAGAFGAWEYLLRPGSGDCGGALPMAASGMKPEFLKKVQAAAVGDVVREGGAEFLVCGRRQLSIDYAGEAALRVRGEILSEKLEAYSVRYLRKARENALIEKK